MLFVARVRLDGPPEERVKQPAKPFVWGNGERPTAYVLMLVFAVDRPLLIASKKPGEQCNQED